jgi:ribosomal protein S15P/S13E
MFISKATVEQMITRALNQHAPDMVMGYQPVRYGKGHRWTQISTADIVVSAEKFRLMERKIEALERHLNLNFVDKCSSPVEARYEDKTDE